MPSAVASNQEQWRPTHAEKEAAFVHIWSNQTTNQSYQICHLHEVLEGGVCLEANNLREPIASLSRFSNVSPVQHLKNAITSFPPMLRSKPRHLSGMFPPSCSSANSVLLLLTAAIVVVFASAAAASPVSREQEPGRKKTLIANEGWREIV